MPARAAWKQFLNEAVQKGKFLSPRISTGKMFARIMVEFKVGIMFWDYIWKPEQLVIEKMYRPLELKYLLYSNHMRKSIHFYYSQ